MAYGHSVTGTKYTLVPLMLLYCQLIISHTCAAPRVPQRNGQRDGGGVPVDRPLSPNISVSYSPTLIFVHFFSPFPYTPYYRVYITSYIPVKEQIFVALNHFFFLRRTHPENDNITINRNMNLCPGMYIFYATIE
jgi:hypothetical protein